MTNYPTPFTIKISDEEVEIYVAVNSDGNLVLRGLPSNVTCELYNEELVLAKFR